MSSNHQCKSYWQPSHSGTKRKSPTCWVVNTFDQLLIELQAIERMAAAKRLQFFYRGQRNGHWDVTSTYFRFAVAEFTETGHLPDFGSQESNLFHWHAIEHFVHFYTAQWNINDAFMQKCVEADLNPLFEIHRKIQQWPDLYHADIIKRGTLLIDWSTDARVATYFCVRGRKQQDDFPSALFIYSPWVLRFIQADGDFGLIEELKKDIKERQIRSDSVAVCPPRQSLFHRANIQRARYTTQQDLRLGLNSLWNLTLEQEQRIREQFHLKIEIAPEALPDVKGWLGTLDSDEGKLFPEG